MYDVIDTETGEVYGSFKTIDEAFDWMDENCEVSEFYNWYGDIEYKYFYNDDLVDVFV